VLHSTPLAPTKLGYTTVARLSKRTGLVYLAWQHGHWSKWHIALKNDLTKMKCADTLPKKAPVQTSNAVVFSEICESCLVNLRRELSKK